MPITPTQFKQAFDAAFIVNRRHLRWDTRRRRTAYMLAYIYSTVANSFPDIEIEYEHNHIDAVLYSHDLEHIDVAIEHENNVLAIGDELENFAEHNFPLNVLITYTGNREEYLTIRQGENMNALIGRLLIIVNPEHGEQIDPYQHNLVLWEYLTWTENGLQVL